MITTFWRIWTELAPWLLLGSFISALLHVLLPSDFIAKHLSGRGGVLRAVLLGVPMPLCSCGVIPAGLGLKKDGASDGATVGFIVSTPQTGVDSILVSAGMLGMPFALFKVASAAVLGLLAGGLVGSGTSVVPAQSDGGTDSCSTGTCSSSEQGANGRDWRSGLDHARELLVVIWKWVVFGVVVSALLTTLAPSGFGAWMHSIPQGWLYLGTLLISVPLYVCATSSVPIAAALVAGGFPPGAALVFLMAGPATNVATIGAVYAALGKRTTAIYLGTIIVGSTLLAVAFDHVLGVTAQAAAPMHAHGATWWGATAGVVLAAIFAIFAYNEIKERLMNRKEKEDGIVVKVTGMTCHGCSGRLQKVLAREDGVEYAHVSLEEERAVVRGDVTRERIAELVQGAGFEVIN